MLSKRVANAPGPPNRRRAGRLETTVRELGPSGKLVHVLEPDVVGGAMKPTTAVHPLR